MKHKDKKTINLWLKDLRTKDYLKWIYDKENFIEKTKPAIYYLGINGIRYFGNLDTLPATEIRKRYREHNHSQTYIDRCLLIAECCLSLEASSVEDKHPETRFIYETEADYMVDSYYHLLSDSELIHPHLCYRKEQSVGSGEPQTTESYLLETFDATLPRYRLRFRLKKYVQYMDEEQSDWQAETEGDPLPTILLVCATLTDLIYAKRRTRGLIADIWDYDDEDRPHIRFTTTEKLKQRGILTEKIWEEA